MALLWIYEKSEWKGPDGENRIQRGSVQIAD
jgi:hypothetical protein